MSTEPCGVSNGTSLLCFGSLVSVPLPVPTNFVHNEVVDRVGEKTKSVLMDDTKKKLTYWVYCEAEGRHIDSGRQK